MAYKILKCVNGDDVSACAGIVRAGGVVVFPTDTVYGIGCDPCNDGAVERVFKIKGREGSKPLPVLAGSVDGAQAIVDLGDAGRLLADRFWPGALTIVAPVRDTTRSWISSRVTAGGDSLAVRVPANRCTLQLLAQCGYLVGTSANLSGGRPPTSAQQVIEDSKLAGFDALLDGGAVEKGKESTIVDVTTMAAANATSSADRPRIVREGAISSTEIMRHFDAVTGSRGGKRKKRA